MAKGKEPEETTVGTTVARRTQPGRNGGTLLVGNPGHKGAGGIVSGHLRTHCRGSFAERVPILEAIADGKPLDFTKRVDGEEVTGSISASIKERITAIETLGKYGGVQDLALVVEEMPENRLPDRADAQRVWDRMRRAESVEKLEKEMVEFARKQLSEGA